MTKYKLGLEEFRTKAEIKSRVQAIFATHSIGQMLAGRDAFFVRDLLRLHPKASLKIGCGVSGFKIGNPGGLGSKGFLIVRTDGSVEDFSYKHCLTPSLGSSLSKFNEACRKAIVPEVAAFKRDCFWGRSSLWSEADRREISWGEAHVDHFPEPFCNLVARFVAEESIDIDRVETTSSADEPGSKFADPEMEKKFALWHKQNATLRVISGELNVKLGTHSYQRA